MYVRMSEMMCLFVDEASFVLIDYVLGYCTKTECEETADLRDVLSAASASPWSVAKSFARKALASRQLGAVEAAMYSMNIPLFEASRNFRFLDCRMPDKRARRLLPPEQLKGLPDNSEDVFFDSLIVSN